MEDHQIIKLCFTYSQASGNTTFEQLSTDIQTLMK